MTSIGAPTKVHHPAKQDDDLNQVPDQPGMIALRNVATGEIIYRYHIDTVGMVECGEFEYVGDPPRATLHYGRQKKASTATEVLPPAA